MIVPVTQQRLLGLVLQRRRDLAALGMGKLLPDSRSWRRNAGQFPRFLFQALLYRSELNPASCNTWDGPFVVVQGLQWHFRRCSVGKCHPKLIQGYLEIVEWVGNLAPDTKWHYVSVYCFSFRIFLEYLISLRTCPFIYKCVYVCVRVYTLLLLLE